MDERRDDHPGRRPRGARRRRIIRGAGALPGVTLALGLLASSPGPGDPAAGGEPSWYLRQPSWHETLLASRDALRLLEDGGGESSARYLLVSGVVRGGEPARRVSVPVAGEEEIHLHVMGVPHATWGAATWAAARLVAGGGSSVLLCDLAGIEVRAGRHSVDSNLHSGVSGPLTIAGRRFDHGVHVYADSTIRVPLEGKYQRFETWIGIDDWVGGRGAARFLVTGSAGARRQELWRRLEREFSAGRPRREMAWEEEDLILLEDWEPGDRRELAGRYARACHRVPPLVSRALELAAGVRDGAGLAAVRGLYLRSRELDEAVRRARTLALEGLRLALEDLSATFGECYPRGPEYLERARALEGALAGALGAFRKEELAGYERLEELTEAFDRLQHEALRANPLLDFERLLVVRRRPDGDPRRENGRGYGLGEYLGLPRQSSKCNPGIERPFGWENDIAVLSPVRPEGELATLYRPGEGRDITDVDLHPSGERLLFSMPGSHGRWHVFEIRADGTGLRQLTPADQPDVEYYDPCYLPGGQIALASTAVFQGVPCNSSVIVGMLYLMDSGGGNIRQICFEQDHDYCPAVLNDGRLLYLRWDYTDTPHVWNRMLFAMMPDGTGQMEYYGSNSYWPNAIFYARPVPGHPSLVSGIVTGHHVGRVGELVLFDPARGRFETDGVVQRIPGRGRKVEPLIQDKLTEHSWPKFLHPWPLSARYFLVSAKPDPGALWGIYLVDVFDNMVLIKEEEGQALLEPIPLRSTPPPPVLAERPRAEKEHAFAYIADIYQGAPMKGIPRGTVERLRVFTYHFGYQRLAGIDDRVGADGPWEVKRVLGTVPVNADGSVLFRIPAKTPISVQPLDAQGRAVQLMRSWMTAMPGEVLSCVGCHEKRDTAPPNRPTLALRKPPVEIEPWYGPPRGFSFRREVQPVLDRYCVGCHDGRQEENGAEVPDLRGERGVYVVFEGGNPRGQVVPAPREELVGRYGAIFEPSYVELRRRVRVGGLESDLHTLPPLEFHAGTSELVQMLEKGHHGVELSREAWDRIVTWVDLNAPCHGTWRELARITGDQRERRQELRLLYGGVAEDGEEVPLEEAVLGGGPAEPQAVPAVAREEPESISPPPCPGWPFAAGEARRRQKALGSWRQVVDLGGGVEMELVRVPAGAFIMGDAEGGADERPLVRVEIPRPFWISRTEVTNDQYARYDPAHDSRFEHRTSWIFSEEYLGWPLNRPRQPVVRVSWNEAAGFCRWLAGRLGEEVMLPSEVEWEYACRAGTAAPFFYGDLGADFSCCANMADRSMRRLAYEGWRPKPPDIVPRDDRFDDGALVSVEVGSYGPNPWTLQDMHGNVAEWTRSDYGPRGAGGEGVVAAGVGGGRKVVRGGSWYDRPWRCRSAFRIGYFPYQKVYNVGFRVVIEESGR